MARGALRKLIDSLLIPLLCGVIFIILFALISFGSVIYSWDGGYNPTVPLHLSWLVGQLPAVMESVLLPTVVATTLFLIYRIRKRPGVRPLSFLLALASVAALLYFGMAALGRLYPHGVTAEVQPVRPFVPKRFAVLHTATLYAEGVTGTTLSGLAVIQPGRDPAIAYAVKAQFRPKEMTVVLPGETIPVAPANPDFGPIFQAPPFLSAFFSDMNWAANAVRQAFATSRVDFAIVAGAILLFCMSCTMVSRLFSWPLLNAFLTLLVFRGLFWVLPVLHSKPALDIERQIGTAFRLDAWAPSLPWFALALLGAIFILVDFTLLRKRGRGDLSHG